MKTILKMHKVWGWRTHIFANGNLSFIARRAPAWRPINSTYWREICGWITGTQSHTRRSSRSDRDSWFSLSRAQKRQETSDHASAFWAREHGNERWNLEAISNNTRHLTQNDVRACTESICLGPEQGLSLRGLSAPHDSWEFLSC